MLIRGYHQVEQSYASARARHGGPLSVAGLGSDRLERSTSGQATSSGVVEGLCGVGLRAKHLFGPNLQAVPISSSSNNTHRMEACSADAAEPLHCGATAFAHFLQS